MNSDYLKEEALNQALRYAEMRARNNPQALSAGEVVEVAEAFETFLRCNQSTQ